MPETTPVAETINCPTSRWFFRRIGLMAALFAGLGLYFLYDGLIGYPKQNFNADLFDAFVAGKNGVDLAKLYADDPAFGRFKDSGDEIKAAHTEGRDGASWASFAAKRHLGEAEPERHSQGSIQQQKIFAGVLAVLFLGTAVFGVLQRKRSLKAGPDWLETSGGRRVYFSDVGSIDFSKWDRGIARLEIDGETGLNRRIRIDDYKFSGAAKILNRIRQARPEIVNGDWPDLASTEAGK